MHQGISVVIPNYNGTSLFPLTLPSVFTALRNSGLPYEVIVADDRSTDNSTWWLAQHYPDVLIVANEHNSGFSVTANRGVGAAQYPLVLLLNSDVRLEPDYFKSQLPFFDRPGTFGVMGRIIGWDDDHIQDGAKYPSFHSAKIKTSVNYLLADDKDMKHGLYTMYLSGANALLDRERFMQLGGFSELFAPFYVEDYELSLRAWRLGWICYYAHDAVCRHRTSTTIRSKSSRSFIRMISNRNKWFLHAIHLSMGMRLLWWLQLIPEVLLQLVLLKGYYVGAFTGFIGRYRRVVAARRRFHALAGERKLLSVREVARFIQASVKDKEVKFF